MYKLPHINKIYEALTAIADERITIVARETDLLGIEIITTSVQTSSRDKSYTVSYQPATSQIMSNDTEKFYSFANKFLS